MRIIRNLSRIKSIIRHSGITVKNSPSVDHPTRLLFITGIIPMERSAGFGQKETSRRPFQNFIVSDSRMVKWTSGMYSLFFTLGLESFLAHGRLVIYTDLPTAPFLQQHWGRDEVAERISC